MVEDFEDMYTDKDLASGFQSIAWGSVSEFQYSLSPSNL